MALDIKTMERASGREDGEPWIEWHHRIYDAIITEHKRNKKWIDPVSKREFPPGKVVCRDPNRAQRSNLERFRRTGKSR